MIYGDNPNKINEREDVLGLKTYTYAPSIGSIMQSGNLYVYCMNNPIYYCDYNGYWVETAFDIATLGVSIADVYNNPDDGWAWAGLIGDVIDLCPFVMGVGEVIKAKRISDVLGDAGELGYKSDNFLIKWFTNWNHRDYYLNQVKNKKLYSAIDELYRPEAIIGDGGTADMLKYEYDSGQSLKHLQKAYDRVKQLEKILATEQLTESEIKLTHELINELYEAIKYVGG